MMQTYRRRVSGILFFSVLSFLTFAAPGGPVNLLRDAGFELGPPAEEMIRDWECGPDRDGVRVRRIVKGAMAGRACAGVRVAPPAPKAWYGLRQSLCPPVGEGKPVTLSVYVRTRNVRDGAGAYCSIACYDATGKRLGFFDSARKLTGTADWTRLTITGRVLPRTTRVQAVLVLHGYGEAFFDNAQLETGAAVTPFQPSAADKAFLARMARFRQEAAAYVRRAGLVRAPGRDIAVLKDGFPPAPGHASPETVAEALRRGGYHVVFLDGEHLANPALLNRDYFDLLVLPYGPMYPARARESIVGFLAAGGHFISIGGYAFDRPLVKYRGAWLDARNLPRPPVTDAALVADFDQVRPEAWSSGGPAPEKPRVESDPRQKVQGTASLHVVVPVMHFWATVSRALDFKTAPNDWGVTQFYARGGARTTKINVEWTEHDGSRWKTAIDLSPKWRKYTLYPSDFTYWPDNPSVGRGGPSDMFKPENAARITFGMSLAILPDNGRYEFWIDALSVACDPLRELRGQVRVACLNTRTARLQDAMWPEPDQIGVFDASHPLERARRAHAAADQFVFPSGLRLAGPFEGWAATAMLGLNGHGFGPNQRRLVPLLVSEDRFGRPRGALGSIVFNYAGFYARSNWAFFGVANQDLFSPERPAFLAALSRIADTLLRGRFLHDTAAEFSCYRPGETVRLQTTVENRAAAPFLCTVVFDLSSRGDGQRAASIRKSVRVEANSSVVVPADWTPRGEADLYQITARLFDGDHEIDREKHGVVVWDRIAARRDPHIAVRDGYFEIDGRTRFVFGVQTWWGQVGSVTARSPLLMDHDLRIMADAGMHMFRGFLNFRNKAERRVSDAWVYLAQKHGVVVYDAPNLFNTADPEQLEKQAKTAAEIAERYRDVPGLLIDTCNEPYLGAGGNHTELDEHFRSWLRGRYGADAALQKAWRDPKTSLATARVLPDSERWDDPRCIDSCRFLAGVQRTWANNARGGFHSARSGLPVSVGWSQGWGGPHLFKDPGLAAVDQDFTDDHYYGVPDRFIENVKMTDRRFAGKPWTLGECGAKNHPAYFSDSAWGNPQPAYNDKFAYLGHQALGLGMAFMLSWHLRDPMEGLFPCGLLHADFASREALGIVRNMAVMFAGFRPRPRALSVFVMLPDSHRHGPGRVAVQEALMRLFRRLYGLQVDYGILFEEDAGRLPKSARIILYPLPYCPPDRVVKNLADWVRAGGRLYTSGDISYDEQRRRTRTERLEALCGVHRLSDRYADIQVERAPVVEVQPTTALKKMQAYEGRPGLKLTATTANVLAGSADGPVIVENRLGKGRVFFVAEPIELETDLDVPARQVLAAFLRRAGVRRPHITPDGPGLRAFRIPLDSGRAYVAVNDDAGGAVRWDTPDGPMAFGLRKGEPGMMVIEGARAVTLAEAQESAEFAGRRLLRTTCHVAAVALDRRDLRTSHALLVLPFAEAGRVEIPSTLAGAPVRAELGEIRNGAWRTLTSFPVRGDRDRLIIEFDAESRLDMLLIAPPAEFATAAAALVSRVNQSHR